MIEFSIPDYWLNFKLNLFLIDLMQMEPLKFEDDIKITSCYGSFPCIWNGGRTITGSTNIDNIKNTISPFNTRNISIRHTFTNKFIDEKSINDILGNKILELSNSDICKNGVNVGNKLMLEYILSLYPDLYILCSTTMCISDIDELNKLSENYIVIPDYNLNNNFDKLIKLVHPENIELLIGEACIDNCLNRKEHHTTCATFLHYLEGSESEYKCPNNCEGLYLFYETIPKRNHYISMNDIRQKYLPLGINKFKISGRNDPWPNVIERYVHWLVKDEYKDEIRNKLILNLISV